MPHQHSPAFKQKQLTKAINDVIKNDFEIVTDDDASLLTDSKFYWDDLTKLKDDLGAHILSFVAQVNSIVTKREVINNLKDQLAYFNKLVLVFFSDINEFSGKVRDLRVQHEGKTGPVNDITEFDTYNRIAIMYQSYYNELTALVTPTLCDLVMTISTATQHLSADEVTDVAVKKETPNDE